MSSRVLLAAHGTREPAGPRVINAIAARVSARLDVPVHTAYVDVIGPTIADVLRADPGPFVVVPAFLSSGYHVRSDVPAGMASSARNDVLVSPALGPAPELAVAMRDRLREAGWRPGAEVMFSAAGSTDPRALQETCGAAGMLGRACGQTLSATYVTAAEPRTAAVCHRPAFIAPYLLAPGLFHRELAKLPVRGVAAPIGAHPRVIDLVVRRYEEGFALSAS
ncbi:sirohydrochlorin chelatase [Salinifilum aidingensis]